MVHFRKSKNDLLECAFFRPKFAFILPKGSSLYFLKYFYLSITPMLETYWVTGLLDVLVVELVFSCTSRFIGL